MPSSRSRKTSKTRRKKTSAGKVRTRSPSKTRVISQSRRKSPKRLNLNPRDYSVRLNGKPLSGVKVSLSTISPGKIRVYVDYPNGRVYSNISPSGQKFSPTKLEWVYTWRGSYDDWDTGKTRTRTLTFRFKFVSETRFKQVHRFITSH
jgi:hypothetical protein